MDKLHTIAIFIPSLQGGGAESSMLRLANGFARYGYKVDLVLADANGVFKKDVSEAVRIVNLDSKRMAASVLRLAKYLSSCRPNVLISAMTHVNLAAIIARRIARSSTRLVISERSTLSQALKGLRGRRILPWFILRLVRFFYPTVDAVVSVSIGVQEDLLSLVRLPSSIIHVIYNPVVDDDLPKRAAEPIEHPWFTAGGPPVVLAVGRLTVAKNFSLLLNAFSHVRRTRPCRLMILGEGPLRSRLEAQVSDLGLDEDVLLPGFVENPLRYMRNASLFVLSSSWEGLPSVLIQAMACGCRVVSTDCFSGPSEILEGGRWGELVPLGNEEALAKAIERGLDNRSPPNVRERASFFSESQSVVAYQKVLFPSGRFVQGTSG
jgi:glycosyltransferase involved in cell wall biosynthesis